MSRRAKITMLALVVGAAVIVYVLRVVSGDISDRILANALSPSDRELPPTISNYRQGSDDIQILGGVGKGLNCSLPPGMDWLAFQRVGATAPISLRMRQACAFHDLCYRHGDATYGYTQADCDYMLQEQSFRLCSQISGSEKGVAACETEARKVTLGVRVGGAGSYRRADHPDDGDAEPSIYYEFDPYPVRAKTYVAVRIADAPRDWVSAGAARKAYYAFRIRPSGAQLRIIGFDPKSGARRCAAYTLGADYRYMTTAPMVARVRSPDEDWLVWWRRENTTSTTGAFSGLAPGRATEADWRNVFGAVRDITGQSLCDGTRAALAAGGPTAASFSDLSPKPRNPAANPDVIVSEFYPQPADQSPLKPGVVALYGLTTHQCALDIKDTSPCLREVLIATSKSPIEAIHEPYRTLDPDCYRSEDNRKKGVTCDRYRNFVSPPHVESVGATAGLAWLRRGDASGADYENSALLTWAPAANPRQDLSPNYAKFRLVGLKEKHEPAAWAKLGLDGAPSLITLAASRKCGGGLRLRRYAFAAATAGGKHAEPSSATSARCLPGIDAEWLQRPWRLVDGKTIMLLREQFSVAGTTAQSWSAKRELQIAFADIAEPDRIRMRKSDTMPLQDFAVCDLGSKSETPWRVQDAPCGNNWPTIFGRARKLDDKAETVDLNAARDAMFAAVHAMPAVVGDMDGDGSPEVAYILPSFRDVILFRSTVGGPEATVSWTRLDNRHR